jgi:hypothetical protein
MGIKPDQTLSVKAISVKEISQKKAKQTHGQYPISFQLLGAA